MNTNYIPEIKERIYAPSSVIQEIKSAISSQLYNLFKSKYRIDILEPDRKDVEHIEIVAGNMGQKGLSKTDKDILALAYHLSKYDTVVIYSDDFGLRNVAHEMKIKSKGVTTKGGTKKREYNYSCRACGEIYQTVITECDICGHQKFKRFRNK